jgi:hypothetical protein
MTKPASGPLQRSVENGTAVAMLAFGALVIAGSVQAGIAWGAEGPRSGFFPFLIGLAIILSSVINLVQSVRSPSSGLFAEWAQLRQVVAVILPTTIYVVSVGWVGLYLPSMLLIGGFMIWLGKYNPVHAVALAAGVMAATYVTFEWWFLVPLPKGPVEDWLGL